MQRMRGWFLCAAAGVVGVVCASCLDNNDPVNKATSTALIGGVWQGSTSDGETVVLTLNQTGTTVDGSARIGTVSGNLTGTVDGKRFEATVQSTPIRQIFANVSGASTSSDPNADSRMSGTIRDVSAQIVSTFEAGRRR